MGRFSEMDIELREHEMGKIRRAVVKDAIRLGAADEQAVRSIANVNFKALGSIPDLDLDGVAKEACYELGLKEDERIRMAAE